MNLKKNFLGCLLLIATFFLQAQVTADFTVSATSVCEPDVINFTDASTGTITSWAWDFGDGNTSILQNPTHSYTDTGNFTITLIVSDGVNMDTKTLIQHIEVLAPVARFALIPKIGCA